MASNVTTRLSVMMFLEYVIWGSWLPLLALYLGSVLGFSGGQIGWIFATQAIASIAGLFLGGQIADRLMPTEKLLAVSHFVGGAAMLALAWQTSFWPFFLTMLVHQLAYTPTLSLTNSISFHHVKDARNEFGKIRLWGTIGWIAASWPFVFILSGKTGAELSSALTSIFIVAAAASFALGAFSLTLPPTPPATNKGDKNAPLEAIKLLAVPSFLVLFIVTFMDATVHQGYFIWTGPFLEHAGLPPNWIMAAMSIGQIAEIGTMAILGTVLQRFGWKTTMAVGISAHALRFFIYALGQPLWLMVGINVVHGMCYAFYFAAVYIFVDEHFPKDSRASAQGLFNLLILGLGPFFGSWLWGTLGDVFRTPAGQVDFPRLFMVPAWTGVAAMVLLIVAFKPKAVSRGVAATAVVVAICLPVAQSFGSAISVSAQAPAKQFVRPLPGQNPPYSLGIKAGGAIYVAGQLATNEKGELVGGDITAQTTQVFDNLRSILKQAGSSLDQVVSAVVMLQNAADFAAVDKVYRAQFKGEPPARTTFIGDMVRPGALIEIQVTAVPAGVERKAILPAGWAKPTSPYNYAIQSGDTLYLSGLVARNPKDNSQVQGDIAAQVKTIMDNAGEILKAASMSYGDVVQGRVALRDMTNFQAMNDVYRSYWEKDRPARVSSQSAPPGTFDVEITFTAIKGSSPREVIVPARADGTPGQIGPNFSPAIRVGNRLFVSGGTGSTPDNANDMKAQTIETLTRLGRSLKAAGFDFKDVVVSDVFITDVKRFNEMNEGYRPIFPADPPTRATVGVSGLASKTAIVEIMVTAVK